MCLLAQRIADINYWKGELERKLDDVYKEVDSLEVYKKRVEKAIESVQEPLHIAQTNLANRYVSCILIKSIAN